MNELIEMSTKVYISDASEESLKRLGEKTLEYFKLVTGK